MYETARFVDPNFSLRDYQDGYNILVANQPMTDAVSIMHMAKMLEVNKVEFFDYAHTPKSEAKAMSQQDITSASLCFERNRNKIMPALQAIGGYVFDINSIPKAEGLDIGSGATGAMIEQVLKPSIEHKRWIHSDVNPQAVKSIQDRYSHAIAFEMSYLDLRSMMDRYIGPGYFFDVVTGLSSLDATQFIPSAIAEVRDVLMEGGYLVHIQDVRPGDSVIHREMSEMGCKQPYTLYSLNQNGKTAHLAVEIPRGNTVNIAYVQEMFRHNIARAILKTPGMELIFNHWVTAYKNIDEENSRLYYANILLESPNLAKVLNRPNFEEASAIVTIARKTGK